MDAHPLENLIPRDDWAAILASLRADMPPSEFRELAAETSVSAILSGTGASEFRELVAETSVPAILSNTGASEFRRVCGPWVSVAAAAAKASFALAGIQAAGPVVDLVLALSGVGNAQTELLQSIKADTLLLRKEPLKTAVTYMGEAKRVGPSHKRWAQFLEHAIESLYKADNLAASSEEHAVVQFGLSCAYLTLEELTNARHWIEESVKSERRALMALIQNCSDKIDLEGGWRPSVPGLVFKAQMNAAKEIKRQILHQDVPVSYRVPKRIDALENFLHFANAVEISAAAASGMPKAVIIELHDYYGKYNLNIRKRSLRA
jgi:hypothetical protein